MDRPDGRVTRRTYWPFELVGWLMVVVVPVATGGCLPFIGRPPANLTCPAVTRPATLVLSLCYGCVDDHGGVAVPNIGPMELIIVLVIVLLIFGPKRLPGLGKQLGSGMREFKDSISGKD